MKSFVRAVDTLSRACGALAAVLVIALIVLMLYDVMMRYVFNAPTLWGFEVNTFLMGAAFILSVGYALSHDAHVRVDLLYTPETRSRMTWVDLLGFTLLMLPASAWITAGLWNYFHEAYRTGERSGGSAWNPVLWPFRLILFVGFLMLTIQVVAEIMRRICVIKGDPIVAAADGGHSSV
ncbi:MAG: TRAP transporter small permease subunit [Hyphomicrobiaceae bacterium]|nr:TRAP transporter small permease subunit [Hyphomicrobiaceae bacterium]